MVTKLERLSDESGWMDPTVVLVRYWPKAKISFGVIIVGKNFINKRPHKCVSNKRDLAVHHCGVLAICCQAMPTGVT